MQKFLTLYNKTVLGMFLTSGMTFFFVYKNGECEKLTLKK